MDNWRQGYAFFSESTFVLSFQTKSVERDKHAKKFRWRNVGLSDCRGHESQGMCGVPRRIRAQNKSRFGQKGTAHGDMYLAFEVQALEDITPRRKVEELA
uniref:Transposase n=1 Tax=Steinernema glaseri TaxID=37863 RepID=A0A1I8A3M6_9BILA